MRLFGKRAFSRRGGKEDHGGDPHDDSIGSDISTKDQFDIVIPIRTKSTRNNKDDSNNPAAALASRSWGANLLLGNGLLDKPVVTGPGSARQHHGGGGGGEDDTTVSSITTSPDWQQPPPYGGGPATHNEGGGGLAENGADMGCKSPFGSRRFNHNKGEAWSGSRAGTSDDDGRTSWACCCAPMATGGGANDYYDDYYNNHDGGRREPPSMMSLGGRSPAYTDGALAPASQYYRLPVLEGRRDDDGAGEGGRMNCSPVPSPSILAHETRNDDDGDDAAEDNAVEAANERGAAVAATTTTAQRSLATAPIEPSGCGAPQASPSPSTPPVSSAPSPGAEPWCCAAVAGAVGLAGLCWGSSPQDADGTTSEAKDAHAAWSARRNHSLFDGLDDDETGGANHGAARGARRSSTGGRIKNKIKHLRRAIVPWGSHLRQRSRSFRKSKGRHNISNSHQAATADEDVAPPLAILATTARDDHYYWKGVAAE